MTARDLPGRRQQPCKGRFARELAPVIEAMWREGMLCHEIGKVLDISCVAVYRVMCERVPLEERSAQAAGRREEARPSGERLLQGVRKAASVLARTSGVEPEDRRRIQALIDGWLAAHSQLTRPPAATRPSEPTRAAEGATPPEAPSRVDLRAELDRYKAALRAGGLRESTINAYVFSCSLFVRWLAGDYIPGPGHSAHARARRHEAPS